MNRVTHMSVYDSIDKRLTRLTLWHVHMPPLLARPFTADLRYPHSLCTMHFAPCTTHFGFSGRQNAVKVSFPGPAARRLHIIESLAQCLSTDRIQPSMSWT
jgi:hypothetical protein